jgi:ribosomal protein S17E
MKKILKALLVLIGMIAMLFVVAVIVNLSVFDEELLPEVQAIKDIEAKPYQADNAYPALIAMSYYPKKSYQYATETIRHKLNQNISKQNYDFLNQEDLEQLKVHELNTRQLTELTQCHTRKEKNCVAKYITNLTNQPITEPHSLIALNRYRQLINYQNYNEATQLQFDSPIPAYSPLLSAQRVMLLNQWLENPAEFIPLLSKDLSFWRIILENNNLLITKMVAIAAIHNDIQISAYVIQSGDLSTNQILNIQQNISLLNQKERDMLNNMQFEIKSVMSNFYNMLDDYSILNKPNNYLDQFFYHPLYQPQASINQFFTVNLKSINQINALESPAFYQAFKKEEWSYQPEFKSPISLYNPSGKLVVKLGSGTYKDYLARVHDLNAMLVLLNLRIELALNNDQNITSVVNNSNHKNPYTNQPFDYDPEAQTIGFDCLDKTSVCEIAL